MKTEAVRLAEIKSNADTFRELLRNPVVEIIAAYVIIELLQRYPANKPIMGSVAGTIAEGGCLAAVGLQQLAPLAPYIAQSTEGVMGMLGKVAPSLLPMLAAGA
jgi:hypothetical protein